MFERLFQYEHWANGEEVKRLREIGSPPERAVRLLAHIVGAEWLWIARLRGEKGKMPVWPEMSVDDCDREIRALEPAWRDYLRGASLDSTIEYKNTKGEPWRSRVSDVLLHVVFHGTYHRGQMAIVLRDRGAEPAYTDYIHCTRIGAI